MWLSLHLSSIFNRSQCMNHERPRGDRWVHSYRSLGVVNDKWTGGGGRGGGRVGPR